MRSAVREGLGWEPPASFDSFAVERPLGAGGMGHVYLGRDVMLDRAVALKFIASSKPSDESKQRFLLEARSIAKLAHPNVVSVFRIGEVEGRPYIAYELVAGRTLDRLPRPMPWGTALRIATFLARGLDAAHRAGIVHRDVKPGNIMLSDRGEVKLLDFGIAKVDGVVEPIVVSSGHDVDRPGPPSGSTTTVRAPLTRPGALVGTPAYLAPELWTGESATTRSDLFAVGLVLWELLTGALPFAPLAGEALARAVVEEDVPSIRVRRPDVPQSFADIVDRCVRRHPLSRWASASELRAALEEVYTVFLPRSGNVEQVHLDDEAHTVAASYTRVLPRARDFTQAVYDKLFAADPSLRELFPDAIDEQRTKLAHALRVAVDGLRDPERLVPFLQDLGRRHAAYGIQPAHFDTLGAALHAALREYDAANWNAELSSAWRSAYGFLATAMRQGLGGVAATQLTGEGDRPPWPAENRTPPSPPSSPPTPPRTRYAQSGDTSLAFHVLGDGPTDLVVVMGWISHLELSYAHPSLAGFLRHLARRHRVILFDKRGTGLSDRISSATTFSEQVEDIRVVMDAAGSERAVVLGLAQGASIAALFAAMHPERTRGVVLWAGTARTLRAPDYPIGQTPEAFEATCEFVRARWGEAISPEVAEPSMKDDPTFSEWIGTYMRMSASPGNAIAMLRAHATLDIRAILPSIAVPTVVAHRRGDRVVPIAAAHHLAGAIPGARLVELDGDDHVPFTGDAAAAAGVVEQLSATIAADHDSGERAALVPVAAIVALTACTIADAPAGEGLMIGADAEGAVLAFSSLDHAAAFAKRAIAAGRARSAGLHVGACPVRTPSLVAPAVVRARELAREAGAGRMAYSSVVLDIGYGVDLSQPSASSSPAGAPSIP